MKRKILSAISLILLLCACSDSNQNLETKKHNSVLDKTVGERIPTDVANKWIDSFRDNIGSGRQQNFQYAVSAQPLDQILTSIPLMGLAFHYALDDAGTLHVLILAVSEDEKLWSLNSNRICIDANTNSLIDEALAKTWTQNFKDKHPDEIWYHFFGWNVLNEMKTVSWFQEFRIVPALNDEGIQQLLLVISRDSDTDDGRVLEESIVYDKGGLCPPCAQDE
jgi:hypothetical protein